MASNQVPVVAAADNSVSRPGSDAVLRRSTIHGTAEAPTQSQRRSSSDWQSEVTSWDRKLHKLYSSGALTDVTFKFRDANQDVVKTLKAHSLLLSMSSTVFEAMFYGGLPPKKDDDGFVVDIDDIEPEIFEIILSTLYKTNCVIEESLEVVIKLHMASDKYLLKEQKSLFHPIILQAITRQNCLAALEYGLLIDDELIIKPAKSIIELHSREALAHVFKRSPPFLNMSALNFILFDCSLNCSEASIFKALILWAKSVLGAEDEASLEFVERAIGSDEKSTRGPVIRSFLESLELLRAVDLGKMSENDLEYDVLPTGVYTRDEIEFISNAATIMPSSSVERRVAINRISEIELNSSKTGFQPRGVQRLYCNIAIVPDADVLFIGFNCYDCGPFNLYLFGRNIKSRDKLLYSNLSSGKPRVTRNFIFNRAARLMAGESCVVSFKPTKAPIFFKGGVGDFEKYTTYEKTAGLCKLSMDVDGVWPDEGLGIVLLFVDVDS